MVSETHYNLVYDVLSFSLATMMASTIFFWLRLDSIHEKYKSAVTITGLVTFVAAYHYMRIFNSWTEAYDVNAGVVTATGYTFNDAYRYMDWLLTVPLLLIEVVLVMNLSDEETSSKAWSLSLSAALMIILGYPGELVTDGDLSTRWLYWVLAMIPFLYIVYTLLVGLADATASEQDKSVANLIRLAQLATVVSWCTYPVVYLFPMLGFSGDNVVVFIQIGYSISDIISKCGVGLLVYTISAAKSKALGASKGEKRTLL